MIAGQIPLYGALQFDAAFVANMSCDLSPTFLDIHDKTMHKNLCFHNISINGICSIEMC